MIKFDNKGNQFFVEIIPDITDDGEWKGVYQLAINARKTNITDDSFFALEQVCQMACAALTLIEEDPKLRDRVYNFLHTPETSNDDNKKSSNGVDKTVLGNIIKVNFNKNN